MSKMEPENATAHCGELNPIIFNVEYMGIYNGMRPNKCTAFFRASEMPPRLSIHQGET